MEIKGIPASPGIAIGNAFLLKHQKFVPSSAKITPADIENQIARFKNGKDISRKQLEKIHENVLRKLGPDEAGIFEGYIEILTDEELTEDIIAKIKNDLFNAEAAVECLIKESAEQIEALDDPYLKERANDVRDIGRRLIYNIAGINLETSEHLAQAASIVVGCDITPSDFAMMDTDRIIGLVSERGGITSHVALMAQTLEIPALVASAGVTSQLDDGDSIILDGTEGKIIIAPSDQIIQSYKKKKADREKQKLQLAKLIALPAVTKDGKQLQLYANIGTDKDIKAAIRNGAEGIGLFRTEFLYMDKPRLPTEDEQFEAYKKAAEKLNGKKVVIRTVDIGSDKPLAYLESENEPNPSLGRRGIRMYADQPDIIKTQLRAILRASGVGCLKIMFPMIISLVEVRALKKILEETKKQLASEKICFDENIEVGVMIETPAAALIAEKLIQEVDFFSIGTNDLTQYTLAVDRDNQRTAQLYDPFHPAVIKLIKTVIDASHAQGKRIGMCGEFAGDETAAILLLGLGLDDFSMSPFKIQKIKSIIRNSSFADAKKLAEEVLKKR